MTPAHLPNTDVKPREELCTKLPNKGIQIPDNSAPKNKPRIEEEVSIIEVPGAKTNMSSDLSEIQIITSNNYNNNNSKADGKKSPNESSRGRKPKSKQMENQNTPEKESR